jgi:hypothetical protein
MSRLIYTIALVLLLGFNICAQDRTEIMKQLLSAPAPTPRTDETTEKEKSRSPKLYEKNQFPPDDAPLEDLIDYWRGWNPSQGTGPSNTVRQRLLDASLDDLKQLVSFLPCFTSSETEK